jgi:pimeloyl-[acyl-carrier protein] methyl ester esterase
VAEVAVRRIPGGSRSLCLIHGWGSNVAIWRPIEKRLARLGQLLMVDLPGHGRSPLGGGLALEPAAREIARQLPTGTAVLGWSLGGLVALRLASLFPDRVSRLALVACNPRFTRAPDWPHGVEPEVLETFGRSLTADLPGTLKRFLALQVRGGVNAGVSLRALREALAAAGLPEPEALRQGLQLLADQDLRAELRELPISATLLLGERDTIVPVHVGQALKELRADLRVRVLHGAAHAPFLSQPEAFLSWLEAELE